MEIEMVLPKKEALQTKAREDFVGVVVHFEYPCNCPICKKGAKKRKKEAKKIEREIVQAHIVIKPIDGGRLQHAWYAGKTVWSSMGAFVLSLNEILGFYPKSDDVEEAWKEVKEYLLGDRAFKFTSMKPVDMTAMILKEEPPTSLPKGALNAKEQWFPIREFSAKEIKEMYDIDIEDVRTEGIAEFGELLNQVEAEDRFFEEQIE